VIRDPVCISQSTADDAVEDDGALTKIL
jgi:hypothetical protein